MYLRAPDVAVCHDSDERENTLVSVQFQFRQLRLQLNQRLKKLQQLRMNKGCAKLKLLLPVQEVVEKLPLEHYKDVVYKF